MIHFFGILQPSHPRTDGDEAPFKRRSFGGSWLSQHDDEDDEPFSAAERDTMVLSGAVPAGISDNVVDDRFVAIAFPPYI